MIRRQARKVVLDCLYEIDMGREMDEVLDQWKDDNQFEFISSFVKMVRGNLSFCDEKIAKYSKNWDLDRIAKVDKNILRMGIAEIFFSDRDIKIAINEAVELAKKYSTERSHAFVNGILDKVAKEKQQSDMETRK